MANQFELTATKRSDCGKSANRRLRRLNKIPAIIYGTGKEPTPVILNHFQLTKAMRNESFASRILTLKIDAEQEQAVVKAVHRHPYKPIIMHVDFQRIIASEKITMHVPLHFIGADVAPGLKQSGAILSHHMVEVEIKCLPADLPEFIEVNVSHLELDQAVHLSDLALPKGAELTALLHKTVRDSAVASIHIPKVTVIVEEDLLAPTVTPEGEEAEAVDDKSKEEDSDDKK